jgi:hypothetical protein
MSDEKAWLRSAELLERAREIIKTQGWHQGDASSIAGTSCIAMSLEQALLDARHSVTEFDFARVALARSLKLPPGTTASTASEGSTEPQYWGRPLMLWNDIPGRTEDEVLKALSSAATLARERAR